MSDARPDRFRMLFSLLTPGQIAMVSLLSGILGFVWHISAVVTEANLTIQNEIGMERQRAQGGEALLNSRIDNMIAGTATNLENIKETLTEMRADIRAL